MGSSNRKKIKGQEVIEVEKAVLSLLTVLKEGTKSAENEVKRKIQNFAEGNLDEN